MLAYLATHEELLGGNHQYTALTVQAPLPTRARRSGQGSGGQLPRRRGRKILSPVCKFLARHGVDAKRVVKVGAVGENIAKVADSGKFDLLVMGSHGHGALATLVMGSVTTQVLAHCKVPLLIVR